MAIWLFRGGKSGQYETKFLNDKRVYLTWDDLNVDLSKFNDKHELAKFLVDFYENHKRTTVSNWLGQIWQMVQEMKPGDWIIFPSKMKSTINIGEITSEYKYDSKADNPFYHYRTVKWFATDVPRSNFDQDLLYSFGAFLTVCKISRNDAEKRIKAMSQNNWRVLTIKGVGTKKTKGSELSDESFDIQSDLEFVANDQIAKFVIRKFKGHGMAVLIEGILKAKGYTTFRSPEGPDKGIDILAAPEPMGFGRPRLCVQVKSTDTPVERTILDQLIGVMQNCHAEQGLLVSWGGFKNTVEKEKPNQFFKVRFWGQKEIIEELLSNYDKLDEDLKSELPLKKVWTLSLSDEE